MKTNQILARAIILRADKRLKRARERLYRVEKQRDKLTVEVVNAANHWLAVNARFKNEAEGK